MFSSLLYVNRFEYLDVSGLMIDQDTVELRAIPKDIEGIGADDLVELVRALAKVYDQDSLSIPPSAPPVRPERIASFLMNEANRITRSEMGGILAIQIFSFSFSFLLFFFFFFFFLCSSFYLFYLI